MHRIIGFLLICSTITSAFPFPSPALATFPPITPVPTPLALTPTPRPAAPGFNNPYYNYAAAPAVPILSYSSEHGLDGSYAFRFSTADGKQAQESGYLKDAFIDNEGNPQGTQVVQGSYAYVSPDGTPVQVTYVADENGFRPSTVRFPADGKAIIPPLDKESRQIYDPAYNQYNPFLNRNKIFGQYNNGRAFDPRYPYNPSRINPYFNNYNPYQPTPQIQPKEETQKKA